MGQEGTERLAVLIIQIEEISQMKRVKLARYKFLAEGEHFFTSIPYVSTKQEGEKGKNKENRFSYSNRAGISIVYGFMENFNIGIGTYRT